MRVFLLALLWLFSSLSQAQPFNNPFAQSEFLPVEKAFVFSSERLPSGQMRLHWQISDGYYLYQKRLKFDGLAPEAVPPLPPALPHSDEYFGETQVYRGELELLIPANATGQLRMGWQGCADAGPRHPPRTSPVDLGGRPQAPNRPATRPWPAASANTRWPGACWPSSAWDCCWPLPPVRCRCCRSWPGW